MSTKSIIGLKKSKDYIFNLNCEKVTAPTHPRTGTINRKHENIKICKINKCSLNRYSCVSNVSVQGQGDNKLQSLPTNSSPLRSNSLKAFSLASNGNIWFPVRHKKVSQALIRQVEPSKFKLILKNRFNALNSDEVCNCPNTSPKPKIMSTTYDGIQQQSQSYKNDKSIKSCLAEIGKAKCLNANVNKHAGYMTNIITKGGTHSKSKYKIVKITEVFPANNSPGGTTNVILPGHSTHRSHRLPGLNSLAESNPGGNRSSLAETGRDKPSHANVNTHARYKTNRITRGGTYSKAKHKIIKITEVFPANKS